MIQISYTNQFNELIPQFHYRPKRSIHAEVLSSQRKQISFGHLSSSEEIQIVSSISASTAGSSGKLSHESNLRGVASLVELAGSG